MGELSQRIGLIHELAQLTGAKELLDGSHQGLWIHQLCWSERIGFTNRHSLFDDPFESVQSHTNLVLKQFANRTNATITKVVNVIKACPTDIQFQVDQIIQSGKHVLVGEGAHRVWNREAEFFIDLVTTNATEVVALGIKETGLQKLLTATHRRRLAGAELFIQL